MKNESSRKTVPAKHVHRELLPEQSAALLQSLHLLTRDGQLNADARRKLKQINHLAQLLQPDLERLFADDKDPLLVDAGAGNGYLGFVLYELWCKRVAQGHVLGLEVRPDLVARARERAKTLGYTRMVYAERPVAELIPVADPGVAGQERPAVWEGRPVDAVVALHACDTATDDAIELGIRAGAPLIAVVPCCQAEVARLLSGGTAMHGGVGALWRHPIHRRDFGANLTNVIRALVLEAHGYQVTVTELTGWEHSLKNELILARKIQRGSGLARRQLGALLDSLPPLPMRLLERLGPPPTSAAVEMESSPNVEVAA